ncbi:MAG: hypothetical protein WCJ09_25930 [Planctomycetota bacterium]
MDFSIRCQCGREMVVSEGSAGARIPCSCGGTVEIPSLGTLRTSIGLPTVDIPLEMEAQFMLDAGELPPPLCIGCGHEAERISFVAECEQIHEQTSHDKWPLVQGIVMAMGLLSNSLAFAFRINGEDETVTTIQGREVNIPVPVHCCESCRDRLIRQPTNQVLKVQKMSGSVLLWAGIIGILLYYYVIGVLALAAGIGLQWMVSNKQAQHQRRLKELLSSVPTYKRVFEKYPDAIIEIH